MIFSFPELPADSPYLSKPGGERSSDERGGRRGRASAPIGGTRSRGGRDRVDAREIAREVGGGGSSPRAMVVRTRARAAGHVYEHRQRDTHVSNGPFTEQRGPFRGRAGDARAREMNGEDPRGGGGGRTSVPGRFSFDDPEELPPPSRERRSLRSSAGLGDASAEEDSPPNFRNRSGRSSATDSGATSGDDGDVVAPVNRHRRPVRHKSFGHMLQGMQKHGTAQAGERYRQTRKKLSASQFRSEKTLSTGADESDESSRGSRARRSKASNIPLNPLYVWSNPEDEPDGIPRALGLRAVDPRASNWTKFKRWFDTAHVLDFESEFNRNWDVLTAVMLVFVAIVTPFELGFLETEVRTAGGIFLFTLNRIVDFVFFLDIIVSCSTAYVDKRGTKIFSRFMIMKNYAKSWMAVDVVSIAPMDTVNVILESQGKSGTDNLKAIRFVRLLRLLKMLRILRGLRIFKRWESRLAINYAVLSLQKYFLTLVLASHWLGCTLMLVHSILKDDCADVTDDMTKCTFLYAYDDGSMVTAGVGPQYGFSLYFATGTIMGMPLGDVSPVRDEERTYFIFCQTVAGLVNAYLLGGMVSSIAALQARNQTFYNAMDNLNRFLKEKRLTAKNPRLCERLRSYYIFRHRENDGDGWKDIVNRTSREMQGEVVQELHNEWLSNVTYFHGVDVDGVPWAVDEDFKLNLSLTMSIDIVAPLEAVFKEDSPIDKLYVIQQGLVGVHNRVLHRGQPFGEDVLVYYKETVEDLDEMFEATGRRFVSRPNSRGYRATALTNLICMAFPGEAIHSLLAKPKYEYVRDQVRRKMFRWQVKHIWLNMMRTMHKAVAAETYADGVQILLEEFGEETLERLPIITFHYMRLRELEGDGVVKVVRLFRKMSNRKSFVEAVKGLVERRRRINSLIAVRKELRDFLEPLEAMRHANDLIAQGVTIRTVKSFGTMELVASGIPVLLAKRIYNKARTLPDAGHAVEELDGVVVDLRFVHDEKVKRELAEMEEQENYLRDRKKLLAEAKEPPVLSGGFARAMAGGGAKKEDSSASATGTAGRASPSPKKADARVSGTFS